MGGNGGEVKEGEYMYIHTHIYTYIYIDDSLHCTPENNTTLKSNYSPIEKKMHYHKDYISETRTN